MLYYTLNASCETKNVEKVQPFDTFDYAFDYKFMVKCFSCKAIRDTPIEVNRQGCFKLTGFNRVCNFKFKCRDCKKERSINIARSDNYITNITSPILNIAAEGLEILSFIPDDQFECTSTLSDSQIHEIDLSQGEWYDYDDVGKGEVSISDMTWELVYLSKIK